MAINFNPGSAFVFSLLLESKGLCGSVSSGMTVEDGYLKDSVSERR